MSGLVCKLLSFVSSNLYETCNGKAAKAGGKPGEGAGESGCTFWKAERPDVIEPHPDGYKEVPPAKKEYQTICHCSKEPPAPAQSVNGKTIRWVNTKKPCVINH